jgi:cellobiose-specific phosphotransferase system component IIB
MMNARTRREMVQQMANEHTQELVQAVIEAIVEFTGTSYIEATEIVLVAWQRSKNATADQSPIIDVASLVNMKTLTPYTDDELKLN